MQKIIKKIFSAPAIRLNVLVIIETVLLLMVTLGALFYFSRQALVIESKKDAEQRLEGTVQHIDNMLLSVEQTAGNFYYDMIEHLDQPHRMAHYCRRVIECNPNIEGCAIAFEPGYYPDSDLFMSYVRRKRYNSPELIFGEKEVSVVYTNQNWYSETVKSCRPSWIVPDLNGKFIVEPVITFCLPINDKGGKCVGVMALGMSVNLLSQVVLENKATPNSYNVLVAHDGAYIVHPLRERLDGQNIFKVPEVAESPTAVYAAKVLTKGSSGEMSFKMSGETWYMFFKPFVRTDIPGRSTEAISWNIASIYPKSDIFGEYNHLVLHVMYIVLVGLLIFYVMCRMVIRKQLQPLAYLTVSAGRIAEGHYDERIPDMKRDDEVGVFVQHFQTMQKALEADIRQQQQLSATLQERHEELQRMHRQIIEDDNVKNTLLHNVTNRMIAPSTSIRDSVNTLCDRYQYITLEEAVKEIDNIRRQSETMRDLLSHKFNPAGPAGHPASPDNASRAEAGKEDRHE